MLPSVFLEGEDQDEDDYEDMVTHRFVLPCQKRIFVINRSLLL